jgi:hypothetical protein
MNELIKRLMDEGRIETKEGIITAEKTAKGHLLIKFPYMPEQDYLIFLAYHLNMNPEYTMPKIKDGPFQRNVAVYIDETVPTYYITEEMHYVDRVERGGLMRISLLKGRTTVQKDEATVIIPQKYLEHLAVQNILSFMIQYPENRERYKKEKNNAMEDLFTQF